MLYDAFLPIANSRAAEAYQLVTGKSITLPASKRVDFGAIAEAVYREKGPL